MTPPNCCLSSTNMHINVHEHSHIPVHTHTPHRNTHSYIHTHTKYFISHIVAVRWGFIITVITLIHNPTRATSPISQYYVSSHFLILTDSKIRNDSHSPTKAFSSLRMHCGWWPLEASSLILPAIIPFLAQLWVLSTLLRFLLLEPVVWFCVLEVS